MQTVTQFNLNDQNVSFTFDEKYYEIFFIVVTSILHNASHDNKSKFKFYINFFGSKDMMQTLQLECSQKFQSNSFRFIHIPSEFPLINELSNSMYDFRNAPIQIPTSSVFCRFFLGMIYSDIGGHMLHMDLDVIVKSDLSELFQIASMDQNNYPIFACFNETIQEASIDLPSTFKRKYESLFKSYPTLKQKAIECDLMDLFTKKYYNIKQSTNTGFNAGVFMFNLDVIRNLEFEKKFLYCMRLNARKAIWRHNDQGILNFIFQDNAGKFPLQWNAMWFGCEKNKSIYYERCIPQFFNAKLLHFNGPLKPWLPRKTDHKEAQLEWEYYQKLYLDSTQKK